MRKSRKNPHPPASRRPVREPQTYRRPPPGGYPLRARTPLFSVLALGARNVKSLFGDRGTGCAMCRWIAYRGETIPLEQYVTAPAHSLVVQSVRALESTASTNGDGFGLGWYGEHPEPGLYREVRPAWSDENLRYLCRHIHSHLYFAHVRASTGTPVTRPNCHPFACGRWLFMHNGLIGNWTRMRRQVEWLIPDEFYGSRSARPTPKRCSSPFSAPAATRIRSARPARCSPTLTKMVSASGRQEPLRFTSAIANGRDLYAFRYAANDNANTLYYREFRRQRRRRFRAARFRARALEAGAEQPHAGRARRQAGGARAVPQRAACRSRVN